jgi:drug/metabolite transporter (DMT)-like permease
MGAGFSRRIAARLVFVVGLILMILGITFLLGSLEGTSRISVFLAFLLVVAGAIYTALATRLNKRSSYLFFASFFMMMGIFLFLSALGLIPIPFSRAWPLLSVFSGLALLPVGWRRHGGFSPRYFVSSCAFVALGCILLVFSLKVLPFSFKQFIQDWWPLLFLLGGITLALISLSVRNLYGSIERTTERKE